MGNVIVRPRAEIDISKQVEYYDFKYAGLGGSFLICVDDAIDGIIQYPKLSTIVYKDIRRKLIRRYPFALFYVLRNDDIIILRLLGQVRNPSIIKFISRK